MVIIYFILGSIFTIVLISLGGYIGYHLGKKEIERITHPMPGKTKTPPPQTRPRPQSDSGPVKVITPKEQALEREKTFVDKLQGYVEPDQPFS